MKTINMEYERPTDALKQRYSRKVDDEVFRLYMMNSRTPFNAGAPPKEINLALGNVGEVPKEKLHTFGKLLENPSLCNDSVYDEVVKQSPCVHSMIYVTRQEKDRIEDKFKIHSFEEKKTKEKPTYGYTYIPYNVLEMTFGDVPKELAMRVDWL